MKDYKSLQNGSDIRGVALAIDGGKSVNLTDEAVVDIALAFAIWLSDKLEKPCASLKIALGRDSRVTGPSILSLFAGALQSVGVTVLDCGMATTPAMFMATIFENVKADGSVMITASHLPLERNGLKFFIKDGGLDKPDISKILSIAESEKNIEKAKGDRVGLDLLSIYSDHLKSMICKELGTSDSPLKGLSVTVDAGNGASGFYANDVLKALGADVSSSQFLEPDGTFPNHQPNPENPEAIKSICDAVKKANSDLGIIFDTDGDRASAVDENASEIARNGIVAIASVIASEGHPGTTIVTDSITSTQLHDFLTKDLGLNHLRFKRGYKNVINKGIEINKEGSDCQLAIETSGHAAMKGNYFLDDGAYLATKIVIRAARLKKEGKGISSLIEKLESPKEAKEFRLAVLADDFASYAQGVLDDIKSRVEKGDIKGASLELPNYEGVRVNMDAAHGDGWFLIRKSLHDPVVPLNIESNIDGGVETIYKLIELDKYEKLKI